MASLGSGLPATLSMSTTAGSVPITVLGCVQATHSLCASVQYYTPQSLGGPTSTTYLYQGLLTGAANSDSSVTVQVATVHVTALQRAAVYPDTSTVAYSQLYLTAPSTVYPGAAQALSGTGLRLSNLQLNLSSTLSYSAAAGQYVDSWGASTYAGSSVVTSAASIIPIGATGTAVPSCSVLALASSLSSAPAAPTCASGSSPALVGDDRAADYSQDVEQYNWASGDYLNAQPVTTGSSPVLVSQVAMAINRNWNAVGQVPLRRVLGRQAAAGLHQ